jgi:pyrroloquinoline quinone biosynthesis protein E
MVANPLALIAEVTHRCPLHCVYCSNPLELAAAKTELTSDEWLRVFVEASGLGVLHLHLSGGEPLARSDLTALVDGAHKAGLYTNLITSGIGMSRDRLQQLVEAGLDHIQLSFQDSDEAQANWIAGAKVHSRKIELAGWIKSHSIAFTANLVVHRHNLDRLGTMISFLETFQPDHIEIANAQYYGWALRNRTALMPTREQIERAIGTVTASQQRLQGKIRIDFVVADYHASFPKACMGGWGRVTMLIDPGGQAMPCHAAGVIPGLKFDSVRNSSLEWIWRESSVFNAFRGESWMPEPCRSCERRTEDFGGCRCQAFLLAGDARLTDPVCSLAPTHAVVESATADLSSEATVGPRSEIEWAYRDLSSV